MADGCWPNSKRSGRSLLRDVPGVATWRRGPPPPSWKRNAMAGEQEIQAGPLVVAFPAPGSRVQKAYHDLWEAQNGPFPVWWTLVRFAVPDRVKGS